MFPKIGVPQNGWFIIENLIQMDDLGGTPIFGNTQMFCSHSLNVFEIAKTLSSVSQATSERRRLSSCRWRPRSARATGPRRTSLGKRKRPRSAKLFNILSLSIYLLVLPSKMYNYICTVDSTYLMHLLFQSWGKNPWFTRDPSKQFNPKVCKKP